MSAHSEASSTTKSTSSVHDINASKPPFGSRFLTSSSDVWSQNAWDHVPPPDDQDEIIAKSLEKQYASPVPDSEKRVYNERPARHWDTFYKSNSSNFFKDRKWLHNEFPQLVEAAQPEAGPMSIVEIGCGAGNAVFPLLSANRNPELKLHAFDYAPHAVKLVQNNPLYADPPIGSIHADVWDLSSAALPPDVEANSVDIIMLVFVLSALHPNEWDNAVRNIHAMLKPNGLVVFRDYGRHDLTQLRFKGGRLLEDNFYIRGDKTRVYFFSLDELSLLFTGTYAAQTETTITSIAEEDETTITPKETSTPASPDESLDTEAVTVSLDELDIDSHPKPSPKVPTQIHPLLLARAPPADIPSEPEDTNLPVPPPLFAFSPLPLFQTMQLGIDRRLIVNRKRQIKMYRVWMQGTFRKAG